MKRCEKFWLLMLALSLATLLGGCIADSAADSDLPWSAHQEWEGMGPIPSNMLHRYD